MAVSTRYIGLIATVAFATTFAVDAAAQLRPRPVVELAVGQFLFADDGVVEEAFGGAAARVYVTPRVSLGPEVSFVFGDNHQHLMLTGNLTCDLRSPVNGLPPRVTPFLVAGGGLFQTRERFPRAPFSYTEGGFTAGGGVRVRVNDRVIAGVEARVGWELHLRINALLGVHLGR